MKRFNKILVYPASLHVSDAAVATAADLALASGGSLTVAWVSRRPTSRRRQARLDALIRQLRSWGVATDGVLLTGGSSAELLASYARDRATDLIVKTARPGDEPEARAFSDIAKELLRSSPCPVWIVRGPHDDLERIVLAAVAPYHHQAELARMDQEVLDVAIQLADARGAELHVASAWEPLRAGVLQHRVAAGRDSLETGRLEARRELLQFLRPYRIPSRNVHVRLGRPSSAIAATADELGAELVVVGAAGRTGLRRWILGNTVEDVLDDSVTAVLGVRQEAEG